MNKLLKKIPLDLCRDTAREEGWVETSECRIADLNALPMSVIESMLRHQDPKFFNVEQGEAASAADWRELCAQQCITVYDETFRIPDDLSAEGKLLARKLRQWVVDHEDEDIQRFADYAACGAFRAPHYQEQFEKDKAPDTAVMAVVFDGGPLAPFMNLSYQSYKKFDDITQWFYSQGYWFENVTHWWAWVMKDD
jgi:hypothetical protein